MQLSILEDTAKKVANDLLDGAKKLINGDTDTDT